MNRPSLAFVVGAVLVSTSGTSQAAVIDTFESGSFSLSRSTEGSDTDFQTPNAAHCIATQREAHIDYGPISQGTMSAQLAPLAGVEDAVVVDFSENYGKLILIYTGGPWDLTNGGALNQISVRITGGGPETELEICLSSDQGVYSYREARLSGTGYYNFSLSGFSFTDVTAVQEMWFTFRSTAGGTTRIHDISTTSGSGVTLIYGIDSPSGFTYLCPARGANTLGWDWAIGPTLPVLSGPELTVTGITGSNCQGVQFDGYDSGSNGEFGEVGMVSVLWQAPTFDDAEFEMFYVTDPNASYVAQLAGPPVVTMHEAAFSIGYDVHISDALGVPDGTVHQELIVSAAPEQVMYFTYADAIPYSTGNGVGHSLSFGIAGAEIDTGNPLLEIYTTGSYSDDAGTTGVIELDPEPGPAELAAHPSVTRSGTRFVLPGAGGSREVVDIFDVTGRRVRQLTTTNGEALWNADDAGGARVPAGVYFGRAAGVPGAARVVVLR